MRKFRGLTAIQYATDKPEASGITAIEDKPKVMQAAKKPAKKPTRVVKCFGQMKA